jgi:hypothetical protein
MRTLSRSRIIITLFTAQRAGRMRTSALAAHTLQKALLCRQCEQVRKRGSFEGERELVASRCETKMASPRGESDRGALALSAGAPAPRGAKNAKKGHKFDRVQQLASGSV